MAAKFDIGQYVCLVDGDSADKTIYEVVEYDADSECYALVNPLALDPPGDRVRIWAAEGDLSDLYSELEFLHDWMFETYEDRRVLSGPLSPKFAIGQWVVCMDAEYHERFPMQIIGIDASGVASDQVLYTCTWAGMTEDASNWNPFFESQLAAYEDGD